MNSTTASEFLTTLMQEYNASSFYTRNIIFDQVMEAVKVPENAELDCPFWVDSAVDTVKKVTASDNLMARSGFFGALKKNVVLYKSAISLL